MHAINTLSSYIPTSSYLKKKNWTGWGKNRPHDFLNRRDRIIPARKPPEPWHMPRRAKRTGTDHQAGVARDAPLLTQSPGSVHSEGEFFLDERPEMLSHGGSNSGRQGPNNRTLPPELCSYNINIAYDTSII
jgi:hypothetical protein